MMFSNKKRVLSLLQAAQSLSKQIRSNVTATLVEVGKLQKPRSSALHYDTGQLFIHKVFGCRGVILFPWTVKVNERTANVEQQQNKNSVAQSNISVDNATKAEELSTSFSTVQPYYQVLLDERDLENHTRFKSLGHTYLSTDSRVLPIHGLESVSHEDILPYKPVESELIRHVCLSKLLLEDRRKEICFTATEKLEEWKRKYMSWLELTEVNKETTEGVRVTVMPFYMGLRGPSYSPKYWWRYTIRLENLGNETITLRERSWVVYAAGGGKPFRLQDKGVIGEEPVLSIDQRVFQYSSHVYQDFPRGQMWGDYTMEKENNGDTFKCRIPPFHLESKPDEHMDPIYVLFV